MVKCMLIQLRAERNLTQAQLAARAGVSEMVVYKMEHGKPVAPESAERVFAVLGVQAHEVAGVVFSKPLAERVNRRFGLNAAVRRPNDPLRTD